MASFLAYMLDPEKALEDKIKDLRNQLRTSPERESIEAEIAKLEAQLKELRERRMV
jgi:cell division septum initiation protein DivIVA